MRKPLVLGIAIGVVAIAGIVGAFFIGSSPKVGPGFVASLSGAQEVPPVTTAAMGEANFMLSADGMSLAFTLNVSNINDVSASHIHLAAMGVNGPVVVPLFTGPKPGPFTGILAQGTITAAELRGLLVGKPLSALIAEINANNAYVNVHTTANPGGEIRGQIRPVMP